MRIHQQKHTLAEPCLFYILLFITDHITDELSDLGCPSACRTVCEEPYDSIFYRECKFKFTAYSSGLGTSTSKEAKEYFADMERHRIMFKYNGTEDDAAITLVSWSLLVLFVLRLVQHYFYSDINCILL